MRIIFPLIASALLLISTTANSGIYKCKDENGKISYQQTPCAINESESVIEVKSSTTSSSKPSAKGSGPFGNWVNSKNMSARISRSGRFQMADHVGDLLKGNWKLVDGAYTVSASFQGVSFPVKMKYNSSSDILYLSKPGFPDTLVKYTRR